MKRWVECSSNSAFLTHCGVWLIAVSNQSPHDVEMVENEKNELCPITCTELFPQVFWGMCRLIVSACSLWTLYAERLHAAPHTLFLVLLLTRLLHGWEFRLGIWASEFKCKTRSLVFLLLVFLLLVNLVNLREGTAPTAADVWGGGGGVIDSSNESFDKTRILREREIVVHTTCYTTYLSNIQPTIQPTCPTTCNILQPPHFHTFIFITFLLHPFLSNRILVLGNYAFLFSFFKINLKPNSRTFLWTTRWMKLLEWAKKIVARQPSRCFRETETIRKASKAKFTENVS